MIRPLLSAKIRRRGGFTLVELLVSAAISVIIMAVLATAFQIGIDTMRQMRSTGDMADQLRATGEVIRRDLQGSCFVAEENKPNNGVKLSDQLFNSAGTTSPVGGFMAINSGAATTEGFDSDNLASTIANSHKLQFTSILSAAGEQNVFTAIVGGQTFTSPAAEICYFLSPPTGQTSGGSGLPLFNLHRRQLLVARTDDDAIGLIGAANPNVISMSGGNVNTLRSLASPGARLASLVPLGVDPLDNRIGEDVLLSNVLSFEVQVNWVDSNGATGARPFVAGVATDFPYDTLASVGGVFDSTTPALSKIRVLAIQIRIRIYDPKLQSARQMTIVQNL